MPAPERTAFQEIDYKTRLDRLNPAQKRSLAWATMEFRALHPDRSEAEISLFFLPLVELGLDFPQVRTLAARLPAHYPLDHRHVYFDFRLQRWMRVLEPPTLRECLEDYLENAPSRAEAIAAISRECRDFFQAHQARPDWTMVPAE